MQTRMGGLSWLEEFWDSLQTNCRNMCSDNFWMSLVGVALVSANTLQKKARNSLQIYFWISKPWLVHLDNRKNGMINKLVASFRLN